MEPFGVASGLIALAITFAGWCVRVEVRLNRDRQALASLETDLREMREVAKGHSEDTRRHGEMLAAIKATVDLMATALHDLGLRLERLKDRR